MARIFLSHSSANNAEAIALRDWLVDRGWDDLFFDLDPERGLKAGQRWQAALKRAAESCEVVIFLISPAWCASQWCVAEFLLAKQMNKRIFGVIVDPFPLKDLPIELTAEWQIVDLTAGTPRHQANVTLPAGNSVAVSFSSDGLNRLRIGLQQAGLDARFFEWPPESDPGRAPYRGLRPLDAEDAGIFFGRNGPIVVGIDMLRGLREEAPPRLVVILGASGAGKSSFMRAGLLPRLAREEQRFLPVPVIRPGRAVISGETGLVASLEQALKNAGKARSRADIRTAVEAGASGVTAILSSLADAKPPAQPMGEAQAWKPPTLILPVDQAEELFVADGVKEAQAFLDLVRDLAAQDAPATMVLFTIRSDSYERLQTAPTLVGLRQHAFSLPPMPQGAYAEVIKGPVQRLEGSSRPLKMEEALVDALLADIEKGGGKDALPLLAFTLERLYLEHGGDGDMRLAEYESLGRIKGSIEAAVERALKAADSDPAIPRDHASRMTLLRHGLIPWLAGLDPDTGLPRRYVARLSEIPAQARPLINLLLEQRLLATDVAPDTGAVTIEPAHEALLRQWGVLQGWLAEDAGLLGVLEGVKRAARDWESNDRHVGWLTHRGKRLEAAERLRQRPDLASKLSPNDRLYVDECRKAESAARRRNIGGLAAIAAVTAAIVAGWWNRSYLEHEYYWAAHVWPYALTAAKERALTPGTVFRECRDCPEMVVVPAGEFIMGAPEGEGEKHEHPQRKVTIAAPFAVSKLEVTFAQWDACDSAGVCSRPPASDWGRGTQPVINISWDDAKQYVAWLSELTGKPYRLLSEAEWEYAARAKSTTRYSFGDDAGALADHAWFKENSNRRTHPVGLKKPNAFGLHDVHGNAWEWTADCYKDSYAGMPGDGSAYEAQDCRRRVLRGGGWQRDPEGVRSAKRFHSPSDESYNDFSLRVARTLSR